MRKLSIFTCLLVAAFTNLWGDNLGPTALTYSVEATPFSTDFGNNFAYYHVNLDLGEFTRVAKGGNVNVTVEFQKGLELKETRFEKKPNGAIYYITDFSTPTYKATVKDLAGNVLLEKAYGGFDKMMEYGKERSYSENDLAEKWLNEKDQYLQRLEFQNLDFTDLEIDLIDVLEKTTIVVPAKAKAQPKRPVKVKLPTATPETSIESEEPELMTEDTPETPIESEARELMTEENQPIEPKVEVETELAEKGNEPINVEAAKAEESVLKDPFAELNEPLADESLAKEGKSAPSAPVDYEAKAEQKNRKDRKENKNKKEADIEESITPVLSDRRNLVKLNLPNLVFGNLTLNYERLLSPRNSATLNVGYIRPQAPISFLSDFIDTEEIKPPEFSGLTATLEYRIYSKKKGAGRGFYYAPYLRYANHKLAFQSDIVGNSSNVSSQLSAVGLGAQIGAQWLIKDRVVIDLGILGLAAQWYTYKSTFTAVDEAINFDEIRADLEMEIEDSPISNKLEFTSDENSLQAKMPFLFGGARAYLSVGYKF